MHMRARPAALAALALLRTLLPALLLLALAVPEARAQSTPSSTPSSTPASYPVRPIRWVVPYTPGGLTDNVTRMVSAKLQEALGQPIAIDNKPGSNSILGADLVAKAAPDGYTLLTVIAAFAANDTLYAGKLPYDTRKSLAPVSLVGIAPLIMTAGNAVPAASVAELITYAKANPGKVNFGSSGIGSAAHLTSELLKQTVGIAMEHIPYKGTAPALQALMGGEIQLLVDVPSSLMGPVRGGRIKALAMFSTRRLPSAPEVPTIAQAGGPQIESSTWVLFLAPAGTPAEIMQRLSAETAKAVTGGDVGKRFEDQGIEPSGSTPAEAARFLDAEIEKWAKVIRTANVKPE